jgi:4-hydroxybenzoyl-CoA reductase subunit beta
LVTLEYLISHKEITENFPVLSESAKAVGTPMIRKTATIGGNLLCENRCVFYNQSEWWREAVGYCLKCEGNICIATGGKKNCFSKFVSDTAVALISLDACVEVLEKGKVYTMPVEDIYTGDGVCPRKLHKSAIIKNIQIPLGEGVHSVFKKLRQRETMEFSSLTTSVTVNKKGRIKIALGGVDPMPVVITGTVKDDKDALLIQAVKKARVIDNDVYSRKYRKEMITVFLNKSFEELSQLKK